MPAKTTIVKERSKNDPLIAFISDLILRYDALTVFITVALVILLSCFLISPPAIAEISPNYIPEGIIAAKDGSDAGGRSHKSAGFRLVRVGLYENNPKIFTDEKGQAGGIFANILNEIAKREKWRLIYVPGKWSEGLLALERGDIDLMPDVAFSHERNTKYDFHEEQVVESWSQVYTNKNYMIKKLADLNGKRIALLKDSIQETVLEQMLNGFGYKAVIVEVPTYEKAFELAAKGTVQAVVSNQFFGDYNYMKYGLYKTAIVFNPVSLYFATASGVNNDLLKAIDGNLKMMKSEPGSVYYRELGCWMERPPRVAVPRYLAWIIGSIGGILAAALLIILVLRRQVAIRTITLAKAKETLHESEEKFRNLFDTMTQGVVYQDEKGTIIMANPAAGRILGLSFDEMIGRKSTDSRWRAIREDGLPFPVEEHPAIRALKTGQKVIGEMMGVFLPQTGETRWILISSTPDFKTGEKTPFQVFSIFVDITDRKRAEEKLKQSEEKFRQLTEKSILGIYILQDAKIVYANTSAAKMFGYLPEEAIGKLGLNDLIHPDDIQPMMRRIQERMKGKPGDVNNVYKALKKDGSIFYIEAFSIATLYEDRPAVMGTLIDVTERKLAEEALRRSEEQLRQAQKMEAVGRLAGGVAHDYNNMTGVVLGYTELLLERKDLDEKAVQYLRAIYDAGKSSAALTKQLLIFSRQSGSEPEPVNINHIVKRSENFLRKIISESIRITTQLDPSLDLITADPTQIEQVIMNLVINASHAMPKGGEIIVKTETIVTDELYLIEGDNLKPNTHYILLTVNDTGTGMDEQTLSKIFDPFFTTKAPGSGTGLGLSVVYGIVRQWEGVIRVYSLPGQGTTFKIYFPMSTNSLMEAEDLVVKEAPYTGGGVILLVEDHTLLRSMIKVILEQYGYEVIEAANGGEAIIKSRETKGGIKLLLTDIIMPNINGIELSKIIREYHPEMPVLYMSGYVDNPVLHQELLSQGRVLLNKPFNKHELLGHIKAALDSASPSAGTAQGSMEKDY